MKSLNILIKPASEKCNMDCTYCFYHDISSKRHTKDFGFLKEEVMETIIDKAFAENTEHIGFAFQGGEPTLWGYKNFEKFVNYVNEKKIEYPKTRTSYALQTNGTLITPRFAKFFHDNNFLIGLSLDGSRKINDKNRPYVDGSATFEDILKASRTFNEYKVAYNILTVVTKDHINSEKEIYNFFKKNNFKYLQFIPCLDPFDEKRGEESYSLTPEDYLTFLNNMFKLWYKDMKNGDIVDIRYFSNLISMLYNQTPESCDRRGICSIQNIIEADGNVYPCDFYVFEEESLGNIQDKSFTEMMTSEKAVDFVKRSMIMHDDCKKCEYLNLCRGGCYRNRVEQNDQMKNYFCHTYYNFFKQNLKQLEEIAQLLYARNARV